MIKYLLHCPFCGAIGGVEQRANWARVYCSNEECFMCHFEQPTIAQWNNRVDYGGVTPYEDQLV